MEYRNLLFIFIAGSLWGLNTSMGVLATTGGFTSFEVAFYQGIHASILLLIAGYLMGERIILSMGLLWSGLSCGVLGLAVPNVLFYAASSELPAAALSLCLATIPIFTGIMAYVLGFDTLSKGRIVAIFIGFLAIIVLTLPGFQSGPVSLDYGYLAMALLASFFYALSFVIMSYFLKDNNFPLSFISITFFISALVLLPVAFDVSVVDRISWSTGTYGLIAVGVVIAIAHSFYVYALMSGGAVQSSFATMIATTMGVIWGMIILGEKNTVNVWISLAMILGALNILRRSTGNSNTASDPNPAPETALAKGGDGMNVL